MNRLLALIMLACALALPALPVHAVSDDRRLWTAAGHSNLSVIKALIEGGADPDARDKYGISSLHNAATFNANPSVIMVLIEGGADPNARNELGMTPLHNAAAYNSNPSVPSVIKALIEGGADPGARDVGGNTPFDYAKNNEALKGTDAYSALESPAATASAPESPADALFEAVESASASEVKAALAAGADPNARAEDGFMPLHLAASGLKMWEPEEIEELAAEGQLSALITPQYDTNPAVVKALIEAGADPNARIEEDVEGKMPLHYAATFGDNPSVIKALIEGGADPNARNTFGETPLHAAALESANPSVIVALIEGGADPGARNDDGKTPFDYAKENEALKGTDAYWLLNEARFE